MPDGQLDDLARAKLLEIADNGPADRAMHSALTPPTQVSG